MLTDLNIIQSRIIRGDTVFAMRIVLTALLKGNTDIRTSIFKAFTVDDFKLPAFDLIFSWLNNSWQTTGQIDSIQLYQNMENYVRTEVVASQIAFTDRLLIKPLPNPDETAWAIIRIREEDNNDSPILGARYYEATDIVIVALLKGDRPTQTQILNQLSSDDFDVNLDCLFEWVEQLLPTEGHLKRKSLHAKAEQYVIEQILPGYIAPIDHLMAIDMPDETTVKQAIICLQNARIALR
ncbi:hypothetical protein QUF63_16085 [Anaerolineales bacterium HSG25]|nr:hypothetical protein [Anaerolineales bacterium HSG25]